MSDPPNLFARLENRQKEETELKNERAVLTEKYQRDNTTRAGLLSQLETAQGQERIRIKDTLDELNAELDRTLFAISDINGRITIVGGKIDELYDSIISERRTRWQKFKKFSTKYVMPYLGWIVAVCTMTGTLIHNFSSPPCTNSTVSPTPTPSLQN